MFSSKGFTTKGFTKIFFHHPIWLTNSVAKILEGFTNRRLLYQVDEYIYPKKFAEKDSKQALLLFILYKLSMRLSIAEIPMSGSSFQTSQRDFLW